MVLLLVHLQVGSAACLCVDALSHSHGDDGDAHEAGEPCHHHHEAGPVDSDEPDHHGGRSHCDCDPVQPFAAPESAPTPPRALSWTWAHPAASGFAWELRPEVEGVFSHPARPPPVGGVSSASPSSLPVMLI